MGKTALPIPWKDALLLMEKEEDPQNKLLLHIGFYTGFRGGDIRSLRWRSLFGDRIVLLEEKTKNTRKVKKAREVAVHKKLKECVKDTYSVLGSPDLDNYVFVSKNRRDRRNPVTLRALNFRIKAIFEKHNISGSDSSHMMRKTWGCRVYEKNGRTEEILIYLMYMFGHSSVMTTLKYLGLQREIMDQYYLDI